jgi:hypothetical protein
MFVLVDDLVFRFYLIIMWCFFLSVNKYIFFSALCFNHEFLLYETLNYTIIVDNYFDFLYPFLFQFFKNNTFPSALKLVQSVWALQVGYIFKGYGLIDKKKLSVQIVPLKQHFIFKR